MTNETNDEMIPLPRIPFKIVEEFEETDTEETMRRAWLDLVESNLAKKSSVDELLANPPPTTIDVYGRKSDGSLVVFETTPEGSEAVASNLLSFVAAFCVEMRNLKIRPTGFSFLTCKSPKDESLNLAIVIFVGLLIDEHDGRDLVARVLDHQGNDARATYAEVSGYEGGAGAVDEKIRADADVFESVLRGDTLGVVCKAIPKGESDG